MKDFLVLFFCDHIWTASLQQWYPKRKNEVFFFLLLFLVLLCFSSSFFFFLFCSMSLIFFFFFFLRSVWLTVCPTFSFPAGLPASSSLSVSLWLQSDDSGPIVKSAIRYRASPRARVGREEGVDGRIERGREQGGGDEKQDYGCSRSGVRAIASPRRFGTLTCPLLYLLLSFSKFTL